MFKKIGVLFIALQLFACAELQNIASTVLTEGNALTTAEIVSGLKEALNLGVSEGTSKLSAVDGFFKSPYKILLPEEARKITDKLQNIPGFSNLEAKAVEKINRGAEDAAKKAKPIFVSAIKSMSIGDAMDILMGSNNAATTYLNRTTNRKLYNEFQPVIVQSLNKVGALDLWSNAVTKYNMIPFVDKQNPNLDDYVANQALKGLFSMVEKKEAKIRTDISQRSSDLLRKVFAKQDG